MVLQRVEGFQIRDVLAFLPFNRCSMFMITVTYAARAPAAVHCPLRGGRTPQPLLQFFLSNSLTGLESSRNAFSKSPLIAQLKSTATCWSFKSSSRVPLMKTFRKERGNKEDLLNFESELKSDPPFHRERKTEESSEIKGCLSMGRRDVREKIRLTKGRAVQNAPLKKMQLALNCRFLQLTAPPWQLINTCAESARLYLAHLGH